MPSEIEVRKAVIDRIRTFTSVLTTPPIVLGRNIADALESGVVNDLRDSDEKIHCIIVTQSGAIPADGEQGDAEYDLWYDVTQYTQYESGEDTVDPETPLNADDAASRERDLIIAAFKRPQEQTGALQGALPIIFPRNSIGTFKPGVRTQILRAVGQLRIRNAYGCE